MLRERWSQTRERFEGSCHGCGAPLEKPWKPCQLCGESPLWGPARRMHIVYGLCRLVSLALLAAAGGIFGHDLVHFLRAGDWTSITIPMDPLLQPEWVGWNELVRELARVPAWIYAGTIGLGLGYVAIGGQQELRRSQEDRAYFLQRDQGGR